MSDRETLMNLINKVPNKRIIVDEEINTVEIFDYDNKSIIFMFDSDNNLVDWE